MSDVTPRRGFFSRVAAFGIAVTMLVATLTVHAANGFFMNWLGSQKGEGFEYHILAFGLALDAVTPAGHADIESRTRRHAVPLRWHSTRPKGAVKRRNEASASRRQNAGHR